jgi:hypothetical protein
MTPPAVTPIHERYSRTLVLVFLGFLGAPPAVGQLVSFGIVGAISLTGDFQNRMVGDVAAYSTPKVGIAGGLFEIRLPVSFSVEINGLYHELEFTNAVVEPNGTLSSVSPSPVVTWEFPVLAKYRFTLALIKPFVELGPAFRISGNGNGASPSNHGLAVGFGLEARAWRLKFAPAIRYLRWARDQDVGPVAPFSVPNQIEFLVGIFF